MGEMDVPYESVPGGPKKPNKPTPDLDPRAMALVDLIRRTGANSVQIRYSDDQDPVIWMAVATHKEHHTVGAGLVPTQALFACVETLVDGGRCQHCHRPTGVELDHKPMPLAAQVCWYQYDPELQTMRRGCE